MISDKDKDKILNHGLKEANRRALVKSIASGIAYFILITIGAILITALVWFSIWVQEGRQKRIIKEAIIEAQNEGKK
jgi:hypothetical protein